MQTGACNRTLEVYVQLLTVHIMHTVYFKKSQLSDTLRQFFWDILLDLYVVTMC